MTSKFLLRCATWNVHRAKGTDGRRSAARIETVVADVIAPTTPDILALQEADEECRPHQGILDMARLATATGLVSVHDGPELRWGRESDGFLGTVLFLSPRLRRTHADVIDLPGHCHRGAISVETRCEDRAVRVVSTHLSLSQPLRIIQMRIIGQYLRRRPKMQTIFLGDFNEWRPWGGLMLHPKIVGTRFRGPARPTFPSWRPLLALDRILTDGGGDVRSTKVLAQTETRLASDHLPLSGEVTVL
ncbi:MAG: endonuclease/exonuclease/phosphatase family protein [Pseudomonadota bacterium]